MKWLTNFTNDEVDPETVDFLEEVQVGLDSQFVPNLFKILAFNSKNASRASWALVNNIVCNGILPRLLKEMILTAISKARDCDYCKNAHEAFCSLLEKDQKNRDEMSLKRFPINTEKVKNIIDFSIKCALEPRSLEDEDYKRLLNAGVSQEELMEVIAVSAAAVYLNILADGFKLELDEELSNMLS